MRTDVINFLAGTYLLLNTSSTLNGVPIEDEAYGANPVGIITYSRSGFMSATLASTDPEDRPANLTFPPQAGQSDESWAIVAKHTLAYAGPFEVSDRIPATTTSGQIFHGPLTVANVPSWIGARQERNYTFHDDGNLLKIVSKRDGGYGGVLW